MTSTQSTRRDPMDRFVEKIEFSNGCWLWTAATFSRGYAEFSFQRKNVYAHRWLWEEVVGPIPVGLDLDHVCHNDDPTCPGGGRCLHRRCVNLDHLEPVSHRENVLRGGSLSASWARRTHCEKGHLYDEVNTRQSSRGRECRACGREKARERAAR